MDENLTHDYQSRRRTGSERRATGWTSSLSSLNVPPPYDGQATIDDRYTSMPLGRRATRLVEEGRETADHSEDRSRDGLLASIIELYTSSPETQPENANYVYPSDSVSPLDNIGRRDSFLRRRTMSMMSTGTDGDAMMDDDDPRVTGFGRNEIDEKFVMEQPEANGHGFDDEKGAKEERRALEVNIRVLIAKQTFILKLAKALLLYGAPSHRLESQLIATARVLAVPCQVIHFPGVALISFQDKVAKTSQTHIVKATARLMLGKLHTVHMIYRGVVHSEFGVQEGTDRLVKLLKSPTIYSTPQRCAFAFCCAFLVCLSSFGGSFIDAATAGSAGWLLAYLQLHAVKRSVMFGNIFEISTAIWVAFVARGLSSWKPDLFCYSAVSTAGVVLILPGFAVLSAALELASKNLISGSARLVWAVSYTLFLGFSLTAGSDMWFVLDSGARLRRQLAAESLTTTYHINGTFYPDSSFNGTAMIDSLRDVFVGDGDMDGSWTFINQTSSVSKQYHYQIVGCFRDPTWQWWRQPLPFWSLFILVPLYSLFSSFWNLQPWRSKQLPVMVAISCFSFAARKGLQHFIGTRNEIVSAVGAFVIGVLGNVYARVFKGTAFTCMVTAVCFLVPSGLAAAGGLAMNYQGTNEDQYTSSVTIGVRMLTVAIGTTVGLLTSSLVVYAFGPKKRSALFAF